MQYLHCEYVSKCGGCSTNATYQAQLESKKQYMLQLFKQDLGCVPLRVFSSPEIGYRTRAEFRIFRARFDRNQTNLPFAHLTNLAPISLAMMSSSANKKAIKIPIKSCPILLPHINLALQHLISALNQSAQSDKNDFEILAHKLYAIEALGVLNPMSLDSTNCASYDTLETPLAVILTLIYHKKLDLQWEQTIQNLNQKIPQHIALIGRSKNQKIILKTDTLLESIRLTNNQNYVFLRSEGRFSQPNAFINPLMISFVKEAIKSHKKEDLLEMYCGEGNFCVSLADSFRAVLATEVVKSAIPALQKNASNNGITNITALRLSGEESIEALEGKREFFRARGVDLGEFRFSHILIDPPRSGISGGGISKDKIKKCNKNSDKSIKQDTTKKALNILEFIAKHRYIIYISCNPLSLKSDLEILLKTHKITNFGLFDQFPHTHHIECATVLERK